MRDIFTKEKKQNDSDGQYIAQRKVNYGEIIKTYHLLFLFVRLQFLHFFNKITVLKHRYELLLGAVLQYHKNQKQGN